MAALHRVAAASACHGLGWTPSFVNPYQPPSARQPHPPAAAPLHRGPTSSPPPHTPPSTTNPSPRARVPSARPFRRPPASPPANEPKPARHVTPPPEPSPPHPEASPPAPRASPSGTADVAATAPLPSEVLARTASRYGLSDGQVRQLETYLDYMLLVNHSMNLTAVRDKSDAWQRHVEDSLALLPLLDEHTAGEGEGEGGPARRGRGEAATSSTTSSTTSTTSSSSGRDGDRVLRVVDVGTGAGLPGMVLAVARPQWRITLLDSLRKRCNFLKEAAGRAGLSNVEVVWGRAEEAGRRQDMRQSYDVAVARAVAETRVLAELCLPFVRVGGLWLAAKGPDPEAEVSSAATSIRLLGGRQVALARVDSHSAEGQRTALLVAKVADTPARYPRAPGTPGKNPL